MAVPLRARAHSLRLRVSGSSVAPPHAFSQLLGMAADVYTTDELRHRYEIWLVRRHITDRSIATHDLQPGEQRLVLQTSEGPDGTVGRLAVAARLRSIERVDRRVAVPEARPRDCRPASTKTP